MPDKSTIEFSIPADFPTRKYFGSLSGRAPKLALLNFEGALYLPGDTPPERHLRWQQAEEFSQGLAKRCMEVEHTKYAHLSKEGILLQYFERLRKQMPEMSEEAKWIVRRIAAILSWPIPEETRAVEPTWVKENEAGAA